jgi:ADP-ribose pyrophosphatase YjhB (NUDIX family)
VGIHLLLLRDDKVLLGLRRDTGWGDMRWQVPAVHLERDETMISAAARCAKNQLKLDIAVSGVRHAVTVDHCEGGSFDARIQMFFVADDWSGEPFNAERYRCARLEWFSLAALPLRTIGYTRAALEAYAENEDYVTCWRATRRTRPVERELGLRVINGLAGL